MEEPARWVLSLIRGLPVDARSWTEADFAEQRRMTRNPAEIQQFFSKHLKGV